MEKDLMINSEAVKALRKKSGWSQEQLAKASGLSLRTIQRVESEGRASLETKVCLAATLKTPLEKLDAPSAPPTNESFKYNKIILMLISLTTFLSVVGLLIDSTNSIFFIANLVAVFGIIHFALSWYFAPSTPDKLSIRSQIRAGFIYIALFSLFAIAGNFGSAIIPSMLVSLVIFSSFFYLSNRVQTNGKKHQIETGS